VAKHPEFPYDDSAMSGSEVGQLPDLVGESAGMVAVRDTLRRLLLRLTDATRPPPLLIQGETGTGKGMLARAIHRVSPRRDGPFVDVNCAAIPETLLEAELFGYERGAFTDARQAKAGLFQAASRGTLFLDELGLLPLALQGKLLTVLEDRLVRRLGGTRSEPVDVWILAATSADLDAEMRAGRFHDALYHRLAVVKLWLPPLRERGADIALLAEHFLARACRDHGVPPKRLDEAARAALLAYPWPGNVRELVNVLERVALLGEGSMVTPAMLELPAPGRAAAPVPAGPPRADSRARLRDRLAGLEREEIAGALRQARGNITHAAARLGIPPNTLRYRLQKLGVSPAAPERPAARPRGRRTAAAAAPPLASGAIRWETRHVAVLQARLGAVAAEGAPAPPEAARPIQVLLDKVASFGGRVEEHAPSAIVAAFGIEPIEDAPRRAALAARAIQAALQRAREEAASPWSARLALHVEALLVAHPGGAAPALDLDGKRRALDILAALVAAAEPGGILASGEAARFLARRFDLVPAGAPEGVGPAWRLGGGERAGFGPGGERTRLVGRDAELRLLLERAAAAAAGRGQALAISGEPGIGKSRLLGELRAHTEREGWRFLEGRCVPHGRPVPYLPFADVIRQLCGISDADTAQGLVDKVRRGIAGLGLDPRERMPFALAVLGAAPGPETLAPATVTARIAETVRQILVAASWQRPLAVAIEDLHWSDPDSEELLATLAGALAAAPLLLIATYRPGRPVPWPAAAAAEIALEPLSSEAARAVLHSAVGASPIPDALADLVLERAEGNPLFVEELARAVVEQPDLSTARATPATVQDALLSRIHRLPEEDLRLLQCAAVIGKDVPLVLLEALSGREPGALAAGLRRLTAAQFLEDGALRAEPGYAFKHVLTQEAAYATLAPHERRDLHRRAIAAIERAHADRLVEHLDQLGHHVVRGEVWGKAMAYLRVGAAPDTTDAVETLDGLAGGSPLWVAGQHARALERARADVSIATTYRNFDFQVMAHLQLGQIHHSTGAYRQATEVLERNVTMLAGDLTLHRIERLPALPAVLSLAWLALAQAGLGALDLARARAHEAVAVAGTGADACSRAVAGWAAGEVALLAGAAREAEEALAQARELARQLADGRLLPAIEAALGLALARQGRGAEGAAALEIAVSRADALGIACDQAMRVAAQAEAERLAGRLDAAEALGRRALELARRFGERGHEARALLGLSATAAARGPSAAADADRWARLALDLGQELGMRGLVARARARRAGPAR
jgi:DNA-binding NtrC family response regulator